MTPGLLEAREAQRQANDGLLDALSQAPRIKEVTEHVAAHGRSNHFGQMLDDVLHPTRRRYP